MMDRLRLRLARLDAWVFGVERWVVGIAFGLMALVVFADVVHRIFTRVPGRLATLLAGLAQGSGLAVSAAELDAGAAPALIVAFTYAAAYGALRTRAAAPGQRRAGRGRSAIVGLLVTLGLVGGVQLYIRLKPDGIVWAPYFGLSMLLWVGLIGGSMATYAGRHLTLEMGEKLWPAKAQPVVRAIAQGLAGAFALLVGVLASLSVVDHFGAWSENPQAALLPSVELPKWLVFSVVPYAFFMMAWRFLGRMSGLLPQPSEPELPA